MREGGGLCTLPLEKGKNKTEGFWNQCKFSISNAILKALITKTKINLLSILLVYYYDSLKAVMGMGTPRTVKESSTLASEIRIPGGTGNRPEKGRVSLSTNMPLALHFPTMSLAAASSTAPALSLKGSGLV